MDHVPVVDLSNFVNGTRQQKATFTKQVGEAVQKYGFVRVVGHGIAPEFVERVYEVAKRFFHLDDEVKEKYVDENSNCQRGYTPFGVEHAKDHPVPDKKEFWMTGREFPEGHPMAGVYPKNIWPKEVPAFKELTLKLYGMLDACSVPLLQTLARWAALDPNFLTRLTLDADTTLRTIYYPPIAETETLEGAVRAAAHEDINFITLLLTATASGLQLLTRDGEWLDVNAEPGEIIVDTGDMMARITNGYYPATRHRVINPDDNGSERLSMPFFVHPRGLLKVPERFINDHYPDPPPPITRDEFLQERLKEIGNA